MTGPRFSWPNQPSANSQTLITLDATKTQLVKWVAGWRHPHTIHTVQPLGRGQGDHVAGDAPVVTQQLVPTVSQRLGKLICPTQEEK